MTCESFEEQISALIDHELGDEESRVVFEHLSACGSCRRSMQSVLGLRSDLHEQIPPMASEELDERILKTMTHGRRTISSRKAIPFRFWTGRISLPVPVATVILVLFIAGGFIVSSVTTRRPLPPEGRVEAVYITTLPPVDVQGNFP